MKVSYNWLNEYVDNMPPVDEVVNALTMHSFEIEDVEKQENDSILDVKILPNRSHDCLSHYGIASEVASVLGLTRKELLAPVSIKETNKINLKLETPFCKRGLMIYMSGLKIVESPEWLKERLKSIGQRPINSVVDITNYLMYAFGQPMHAFDASKLLADKSGNYQIYIRPAKKGEKVKLLNGNEYELNDSNMVIADKEKALDLAGVMGGFDTGVSESTTDIVLSLSAFDAVSIRKTSSKLKVKSDASQRFENDISSKMPERVLPYALKLISEISGGEVIGGVDIYSNPEKQVVVETSVQKISDILGAEISVDKIIEILGRQKISSVESDGKITVTIPFERLDLTIPEDIAEEVGRIYGYENIAPVELKISDYPKVNKIQYISNIIRQTLIKQNFSEIYTYSLVQKGEVEIENPIASDKAFLRKNLSDAMAQSLELNSKFLDLLDISEVKLFEIGNAFKKNGEFLQLSIGVKYPRNKKQNPDEEVSRAISNIEKSLGISFGDVSVVGGMAEINLDKIFGEAKIPEKYSDEFWNMINNDISWKSISPYPFAVRDVAFFSNEKIDEAKIYEDIKDKAGKYLVRLSLFDVFSKDFDGVTKTSYAYHLVFQASDKTLVDEEITVAMDNVYSHLKSLGFEIR